ncbi:hypothetical protein BRADI_4g18970v3 [Brachypodium distachyon]|uniref:FAD-binding PCMH-type domain-containing protein n=1 Tax=Brachypodium distachyon TaxID=15368 RepID=A0A2K2CNN2_BRADI|nr:hypothetical protein BRADI_4g18970v3 [Brachypodium distachyon]
MAVSPVLLALVLIVFFPTLTSCSPADEFIQCLSEKIPSELLYPQNSTGFMSVLSSSVQNPKFLTNTTARPSCIVTATAAPHVQDAGLSYRSVRDDGQSFAVLDLARLRAVSISRGSWWEAATAWVDSGATLGELYYAIGKASPTLAFPGGACPTVGVGGFLSGGGIGLMTRKYGIGTDSVVDARVVNADGELLDRGSMGEDLFWAIRGGGGESFGVVVSWRLKLSSMVSPTVTVFNIGKTFDESSTAAVLAKWETLALDQSLPDELTIRVALQGKNVFFQALFLGGCTRLEYTMRRLLPELGMSSADCREMSWLRAMSFISLGSMDTPVEAMLNRTNNLGTYVKNRSDYVRRAVGKAGWESISREHLSPSGGAVLMILEPHGGAVARVSADSTPYPHRAGVLYNVQYAVYWCCDADGGAAAAATGRLDGLYGFMEPMVSSNPREAFANYRDLDIGQNAVGADGLTAYESGRVWGERYFMGNFRRLAAVKGKVDPGDYFRNEQSIPPLLQ